MLRGRTLRLGLARGRPGCSVPRPEGETGRARPGAAERCGWGCGGDLGACPPIEIGPLWRKPLQVCGPRGGRRGSPLRPTESIGYSGAPPRQRQLSGLRRGVEPLRAGAPWLVPD
ncbi:hypothetical protein NDU88_001478 [Pleurodeles waltl]|uniref:Uncharacterized protein n=1 Tax=Pleurodeles waltl TaxID=8319 RepID=A0AAV7TID9_PLEWA|nr:hypothetical protein NDU88_001478 [Pleurodeles waltl]